LPQVKALIVSGDEPARQALRDTLLETGDIDVVGEADNAVEAVEQVTSFSPDVVLLDAYLPHISGLETTRILKGKDFQGAIIVLSDDIQEMEAALQSGAVGYLIKNGPAEELHGVIQQVLEGEFAFGADVMGTREGMMIALRYITGEAFGPAQAAPTVASERDDDEAEDLVADMPKLVDEPVAEPPAVPEVAAETPTRSEPDRDEEVMSDVDMVISPPVDTATVLKLYQWLQGVAFADVNEVVGSWTGDTVVKVTLRRPIPLIRMLSELPEVMEVSEEPYAEVVGAPSQQAIMAELARGRTPPTRIRLALRPE
jgi:DNA-binding NarL/FixJ family response regulator